MLQNSSVFHLGGFIDPQRIQGRQISVFDEDRDAYPEQEEKEMTDE